MIKEALHALQNKQIILYPTDTVWGIGCLLYTSPSPRD